MIGPKAAAEGTAPVTEAAKAGGDVPKERPCLRCQTPFRSEGFGERICKRCKGQNAWRNAAPTGTGGSRRR